MESSSNTLTPVFTSVIIVIIDSKTQYIIYKLPLINLPDFPRDKFYDHHQRTLDPNEKKKLMNQSFTSLFLERELEFF